MGQRKKRARHSALDENYWDRLDNVAKLFPSITNTRSPNVFRICALLKDEVDPEALQTALEKALSIMPSFSVKLHRGLFWYYFDINTNRPIVREEHSYPCAPIYRAGERGFLFRVTYYNKRINLEMYHALTDGLGAMSFMRLLVYCYFSVLFPHDVPEEYIRCESDEVVRDFGEDSFVKNVADLPDGDEKPGKLPEAYRLGGYSYDGTRLGVLSAVMPADSLLGLAKKHGATLSEYVCALLIWSIYNTSYRRALKNKPIAVSIPVNLRGMFDSITLRNFFGHLTVSVIPEKNSSFEEILAKTKECFSDGLTKNAFEREITNHVKIEHIPGIKFVPRIIKDIVMRFIFAKNDKRHTMTFSNLGRITLPDMISDRVDRIEVLIGGSQTHVKKTSLCSYKNNIVLTFSSTVDNNSIEQYMLSYLAKCGIDIVVSSNETPAPVKQQKPKKEKVKKEKVKKGKNKSEVDI